MDLKKEVSKMAKFNEKFYKLASLLTLEPFFIQTFITIITIIPKIRKKD